MTRSDCNKQDNFQARHIFRQASNLDETAGMFFALIGWTHALDLFFNWSDDPLESRAEMEKNTLKALALNDGLDVAHFLMAYIHVFNYEYDQAIYEAKKAVDLNPNGADAILCLGHITCISGEPEKGVMLMNKGFRLNPLPQVYYYSNLGDAYMMNGQYEKAIEVLNQGIMIQPEALNPYIYLAGCYIMLNEFDKAKKAEKKILEIDPNFSFKHFKSNLRKKNQIKIEEGIEHLRKAGLPD